jgi:serine/threonine-protein phosphatase PGAM5
VNRSRPSHAGSPRRLVASVLVLMPLLVAVVTTASARAQSPPAPAPPANPTVRTLYLIRHGAYDTADERPDSVGKALTPLGIAQIRLAAARLKGMPVHFTSIRSSRLTRARESARVLAADFPDLAVRPTPLLNECTPPTWRADVMADSDSTELADCTAQLEAAWTEFTTPPVTPPAPGREGHDILVCHGNVIRWFVTKALQVDTMAWLQMGLPNASLTTIQVRADGTGRVVGYADSGHLPPNMITGMDRTTRELVVPAETDAKR